MHLTVGRFVETDHPRRGVWLSQPNRSVRIATSSNEARERTALRMACAAFSAVATSGLTCHS